MSYNWIKKVYKEPVKRPKVFPIPTNKRSVGNVTMSIEELRELRRSYYYEHPDPDLTDRLIDSRLERELKINNDIERRKYHKNERDRIMESDGTVLVDICLVSMKKTKTTVELCGLDH